MRQSKYVSLGLIVAIAACAGTGLLTPGRAAAQDTTKAVPAAAPAPKVKKGGANLITEAEVNSVENSASSAMEVIQKLRPSMLRRRTTMMSTGATGAYDAPGIVVYLDDVRQGGLESLASVSVSQIKEIRLLSANDATQKWGTGLVNGVIQVITKR